MAAANGYKQSCPGCGAPVAIKSTALVGKKVECPKCKYRFIVEEPEGGGDKEAKAKKTAPAAPPAKKGAPDKASPKAKKGEDQGPEPAGDGDAKSSPDAKKKKKGGMKWQLVIGGVGFVILAVAGVLYLFVFGPEDKAKKPSGPSVASAPSSSRPKAKGPNEDAPVPAPMPMPMPTTATPPMPTPMPMSPTTEKPAPPAPMPMPIPPVAAATPKPMPPDNSIYGLIDRLETAPSAESDKLKVEILKKLETKEDRVAGLNRLREKATADEGGDRSFVVLGDAAKSSNAELKQEAAKAYEEAGKARGNRAAANLRDEPTNMLPSNTQVVVNIPVKKFMDTVLSNAIFRTRGAFRAEDFKARIGIPLANIDRVVIGGNKEHSQTLSVIRTFEPYDWEAVKQALQIRLDSRKAIRNKEYYLGKVDFLTEFFGGVVPIESLRSKAAIHRKDAKTLVYGDVKTIEAFIILPPQFRAEEILLPTESGFPGAAPGRPKPATPPGTTPPPPGTQPTPPGTPPPGTTPPAPTGAPAPGQPPAGGPPLPTARQYLTIRPELRRLIERAENQKKPLLVYAEDCSRPPNNARKVLAPIMPFLEDKGSVFPLISLIAVAWNEENPMTVTAAAACPNKLVAQVVQAQLENKFTDAARRELKDAVGFEFMVQGSQTDTGAKPGTPGAAGLFPGFPGFPGMPSGDYPGMPTSTNPGRRPGATAKRPPALATTPGQPGKPAEPEKEPSAIDIYRQDEFLTVMLTVTDNLDPFLANAIAPQMMYLRGQMEMNSGRLRLRDMATAFATYAQDRQGLFPMGAAPRPTDKSRGMRAWPPNERVSWMRDVLPFMGDDRYTEVFGAIDPARSWRDPENIRAGRVLVSQFLNPESKAFYTRIRSVDGQMPVTHFVGMAGIGPDAASLPKDDNRAGIFGNDRQIKMDEIKDGASNTIYVIQTDPVLAGPWIAGGGATVRGTSAGGDRDVGVPGGFVSPPYNGKEGVWVLMADGSARFLAKGVSPQVFKDLCTVNSGAGSYELHIWAPKVMDYSLPLPKAPAQKEPSPMPENKKEAEAKSAPAESKPAAAVEPKSAPAVPPKP